MRIVFLMNRLDRSGGSRVIQELSDGLIRKGHEVIWHCRPGERVDATFPTLARLQFPGTGIARPNTTFWNTLGYFRLATGMPSCDVVVATFYPTSILAWWLSRRRGPARKGAYFIQMLEGTFRGGWRPWISDLTYRIPLIRIVNSAWMEREVLARAPGPIARIRLGLDPRFAPSAPPQPTSLRPIRIGCVGRTLAVKGLDDYWEMLRILQRTRPVQGVVMSQEPIVPPEDLDIEMLRPTGDGAMLEAYRSLDLFVSTSRLESFGYPPLEAMACGIPVALTDSGGVGEYAVDRGNCLMVEHSNPQAIASACEQILSDDALRAGIVSQGLRTAGEYSWSNSVAAFEAALLGGG